MVGVVTGRNVSRENKGMNGAMVSCLGNSSRRAFPAKPDPCNRPNLETNVKLTFIFQRLSAIAAKHFAIMVMTNGQPRNTPAASFPQAFSREPQQPW